jgi:hypothetical protein
MAPRSMSGHHPKNPLRFPARRHVLTAALKITDIPDAMVGLQRMVAQTLREIAADEVPAVAARLLEIADAFDERGTLQPPPPTPHEVVPLKPRRKQ